MIKEHYLSGMIRASILFILAVFTTTPMFSQMPPAKEPAYKVRGNWVYYGGQKYRAYDGIYYIGPGVIAVKSEDKWGFADTTGRMLVKYQFTDVQVMPGMPVVVFKGEKRGFVSRDGKLVIDAVLDDIMVIKKGYIKIKKGDKSGLISADGRMILAPDYDGFDYVQNGRLIAFQIGSQITYTAKKEPVRTGGKIGFADTTGKVIVQAIYDDMADMDTKVGLVQVMRDGKSGLIDLNGKEVLAPKYDWINNASKFGYLQIRQGTGMGLIDTLGNEIIAPNYEAIFPLDENLIAVEQNDKWGIIGPDGATKIDFQYTTIATMFGDRILVKDGKKWGIIDSAGKTIVEPKYDKVDHNSFDKGVLPVRGDRQIFLVDMNGRELLGNFKTFESKLANGNVWVRNGNEWKLSGSATATYAKLRWYSPNITIAYQGEKMALVDNNGKLLTKYEYDTIRYINNNLACVAIGKKNGLVNSTGQLVLPVNYYLISSMGQGMCAVCEGEYEVAKRNGIPVRLIVCKWGFTDSTGKMIIQPAYDNYEEFLNGYAPVMTGKKLGLIDSTGKVVLQPKYDRLTPFQGDIAFVKLNGLWGVINRNGAELIEPRFVDDYKLALPKVAPELKSGYYPKLENGYATVFEGRKMGLVNSKGKLIAEPKYDKLYVNIRPTNRVVAIAQIKKKWGAIDQYGEEIIKPQFLNMLEFSEGKARIANGTLYGYVDEGGTEVIEQSFTKAGMYENGWSVVAILLEKRNASLKFFLIDHNGTPMPIQ